MNDNETITIMSSSSSSHSSGMDEDEEPVRSIPTPTRSKTKKRKKHSTVGGDDPSDSDSDSECTICCERFTNSGPHRLSCLKCGHTNGQSCLEKWVKAEGRCPQCNSKAHARDIRILYAKRLKAVDTAEKDRVLEELKLERQSKAQMEIEHCTLKMLANSKEEENIRLRKQISELMDRYGSVSSTNRESGPSIPRETRELLYQLSLPPQSQVPVHKHMKSHKFYPYKSMTFKDGECRLGGFSEYHDQFIVTHAGRSALFPHGIYSLKRFHALDGRQFNPLVFHSHEIRDLGYSRVNKLVLSVGLDKRAVLSCLTSEVAVSTFVTEDPLWSCAWNETNHDYFYAGTSKGDVFAFDVRVPGRFMKVQSQATDRSPVGSLKYVSNEVGPGVTTSALLVQRLNSITLSHLGAGDAVSDSVVLPGHPGPYMSVDFNNSNRHVLVSTRNTIRGYGQHIVGSLSPGTPHIADIVQAFPVRGSLAKITRSKIFIPGSGECCYVAGATGPDTASIYNLSGKVIQELKFNEQYLDFVPCQLSQSDFFFLGTVSSRTVNLYKLIRQDG